MASLIKFRPQSGQGSSWLQGRANCSPSVNHQFLWETQVPACRHCGKFIPWHSVMSSDTVRWCPPSPKSDVCFSILTLPFLDFPWKPGKRKYWKRCIQNGASWSEYTPLSTPSYPLKALCNVFRYHPSPNPQNLIPFPPTSLHVDRMIKRSIIWNSPDSYVIA